jgi:Glycosyltransferase family 87
MIRRQFLVLSTAAAVVAHVLLFLGTGWLIRSSSHPDLGCVSITYQDYYDVASRAMEGQVPYRDYLFEYPVLSFPLFLIPRLLVSDFPSYRIAFAAEMLLFDIAAIVLIVRHVSPRGGKAQVLGTLAWYTVFCFVTAVLVVGRFDLAPMVLAFAAAHWWFAGRSVLGGFTAGLGTLMKVFPVLVAPIAALGEAARLRATRGRGTAALVATLAAGGVVWFLIGGVGVLDSFRSVASRGLGIETVYAGAVLAWGKLAGIDVPWVIEHKAVHLAPEWGSSLATLAAPLQAVALLLVVVQFWRSGMTDGMRYAAAAVLATLVTSKVLSPQYLIWLFPFLSVLGGWTGSRVRWLFLFCCVITALIYPGPVFAQIRDHQGAAVLVLNLRNVLLLVLLALLLFGPAEGATKGLGTGPGEPVASPSLHRVADGHVLASAPLPPEAADRSDSARKITRL